MLQGGVHIEKKDLKEFAFILFVIIMIFLFFYMLVLKEKSKRDGAYKKLDLELS